jgi:hypothetical protein
MGLRERLAESKRSPAGPRCLLCLLLSQMSGDDLDILEEALKSPAFTSRQIATALEAEGYEIRMRSISRHRRGDCRGLT